MTRRWRWFLAVPAVLAAFVLLVIAALLAAVFFEASIDATRWRDALAQRASAALGRPVLLQGELRLRLGHEPVLKSGGLRVLNPPGFSAPEFLGSGRASVRFSLLDALRGRLHLRGIEVSDVRLALEQAGDGRGNWVFPQAMDAGSARAGFNLGSITLRALTVSHFDARSAVRRSLDLDELTVSAGPDDAVRLMLRGRAASQLAYKIRLDGGPLALLQDGSRPWPFTLAFDGAGAWLQARGDVDAGRARFDFDASAAELAPLGRLLGMTLPQLGSAALQGAMRLSGDGASITELRGRLGGSEVSGQLALALSGARPRLSGALSAEAFDLSPFFAHALQALDEPPASGAAEWPQLALRDLLPFDLDLDLSVGHWLGLPADLRDTRVELRASGGSLRMPMSAMLAGLPVTGLLELDTLAPTSRLALRLDAKDIELGPLAQQFAADSRIEGRLGGASLRVAGSGDTLAELLRKLDSSLAVTQAQASLESAAGGRPVAITQATLNLALRPGERLRGSARGILLGEPAALSLRGGTLADMLHGPAMPFDIELAAARALLRVEGWFARPGWNAETRLNFAFSAPRSGDLARWLGVAPESELPVALNGGLHFEGGGWRLADTTLRLGRSELAVNARHTFTGGTAGSAVSLRSRLIDVQQLLTLHAGAGLRLDAPILSAAIELADADLQLRLDRVLLGRTELLDIGLDARVREGRLPPSALKGRLAGAPFSGLVGFDLRGPSPEARLELSTADIDVGEVLRGLGVAGPGDAESIEGRAQALQFTAQVRGNTLRELATQAAGRAQMSGGSLALPMTGQQTDARIRLDTAVIAAAAGEPLRAWLDGTLAGTPVHVEMATGTLVDLLRDASRLPFTLVAQAAQTRLALAGDLALPLGSTARLNFELSGKRLDTLSDLARVELPAWGPWSLRGPLRLTPTGGDMPELQLRVGESQLGGSASLDISGPRPRLKLQVAAPHIQLDDFPQPPRLADASEAPPSAGNGDSLRVAASRLAGQTEQLLSAGFLRRFDATINVDAQEVFSGADRLADGSLHLKLQDGRLHLDPAVFNLPGGRMRLAGSYDLKGAEVEFAVAAHVQRFDYGIIARRTGRAEDISGLFSLNLELAGKAPSLATIMRNANGKVDFAVWPNDLRSGVFNLWSVNLVLTLLPLIDPGGNSRVNCVVGRFDLRDGKLTEDNFLIDTTRVRVRGTGQADLASEELAFVFRPRGKGLALFRLQTPLRVSGTLTNQRFGFMQRDLVESTLRLIASPILLPVEWFTLGPLPRDGADVCTNPLRASGP